MSDDTKLDIRWRALAAYPFRAEIETRWSDTDVFEHLNNVCIASIYQEARHRFMTAMDGPIGYDAAFDRQLLVEVRLRYFAEARYPDAVTVGCRISHIGRSSFRIGQGLFQNGALMGACDAVFVNSTQGTPLPLSEAWHAALRPMQADGNA